MCILPVVGSDNGFLLLPRPWWATLRMSLIWSFLGEFCTPLSYSPYQTFQFLLKNFCSKAVFFFFSVLPETIDFWWPTVLYTLKIIFSETVCCRLTALVNWHSGCASSHLLWELGSFSICWHSLSENENSIEVHDGIIKYPSKKQEVAVFAVCQCFYAIQAGVAHVCMLNSYYQKQHIFGYMSPNPHTNQHSSIIKLN